MAKTKKTTVFLLLSATFALGSSSVVLAQDATSALFDLMEPGSVIKDLLIPQYDENRLATAVLRAEKITVLSKSRVEADHTSMHLIRHKVTANIGATFVRIENSTYDAQSHLLDSHSPLRATSSRFDVQSQGLLTSIMPQQKNQQIFLRPPVLGILNPIVTTRDTTSTSMKTSRILATALLAALPAPAQEKPNGQKVEAPDLSLLTMTPRNQEAEKQLLEFAKKNNIPLQAVTPPALPPTALLPIDPAQEIPQFKATPDAIGFVSKGGVFYDSTTSTLTFLDNVTLRDPSYAMTVSGKIVATFVPQEKTKADEKNDQKKNPMGNLTTIHGSGGVAFEAIDKDGVKNYAFGDEIIYDKATETATLTGKRLIFQKGDTSRFESQNPDAWLKYNLKSKNTSMSDGWKALLANPSPKKQDDR